MPSKGSVLKRVAEMLGSGVKGVGVPREREFQPPVPFQHGALSRATQEAQGTTGVTPYVTPGSPLAAPAGGSTLENPSRRQFLQRMAVSAANQSIPSPLKAAAKALGNITPTPQPVKGKLGMGDSLSEGAMGILGEDEDGNLSYLLSELSPVVAKKLKKLGLFMDEDMNVHYNVDNFPKVSEFLDDIRNAYEKGDSELWRKLELHSDDDVDYNSGYPATVLDAISTHLVDSNPERFNEFRSHPWLKDYISQGIEE